MNPTERYFKAYDHLDDMERAGCSWRRIARLKAWVDKLAEESAAALVKETRDMRAGLDVFATLGEMFKPMGSDFWNNVSQRNRDKRA